MAGRRPSRISGDVEIRLRALEQQLGRYVRDASAGTVATAGGLRDMVASTLIGIAERLRGGLGSMGASKFGGQAVRSGNAIANRLADEIHSRPVLTLAAALGIGILIGLGTRRGS
ncbi:MAG: hypothetical protein IRY89_13325 [Pseudolabrys sp.]|nr:hypothetical protein [Pseudolabrys sp.]